MGYEADHHHGLITLWGVVLPRPYFFLRKAKHERQRQKVYRNQL